ncbi:MAG: VWA domain-containing protein [bacterium]
MSANRFIALGALLAMLWAVPVAGTAPFIASPTPGVTMGVPPNASPTPPNTTPEPDAEVVRVETNLANALFTATDKDHHFITSLRASDIGVFENDVPQTISLFERETDRPLSLAILVDTSGSQEAVLPAEKSAARAFIDSVIRPNIDQASVISFTGIPKVEQTSTNDLRRLHAGIERVKVELPPEPLGDEGETPINGDDPRGYTAIWDAAWMAIESLQSKAPDHTRRAIIMLTDGDDTRSKIKKQDVIDFAVKSDVVIYSIGIRDRNFPEGKLDAGALRKVSDHTGGRAFFPTLPSELPAAFAQIDQELRSQYLIAYSPTNKSRDGSYRRIRIAVINPELRKDKPQLFYRQGYYAKATPTQN